MKAVAGATRSFGTDAPVPLFEAGVVATSTHVFEYDVTADGKRFLVNTSSVGVSAPLTVVVNWSTRLEK